MGIRGDGKSAGTERGLARSIESENGVGFNSRNVILPVVDDAAADDADGYFVNDGDTIDIESYQTQVADDERAGHTIREPLAIRLDRICVAIDLLVPELAHQVEQIEKHAETSKEAEAKHLRDIARGYSEAARWLKMLKRYQRGRLRRMK